ncbi:hypothetical protein [Streptomyces sp. NPDC047097]|uniref:hypothetical protein n=1 Tax=Streptomyces sp. NPDC047097 TaxID=3155260 RepID=UPI0033F344E4
MDPPLQAAWISNVHSLDVAALPPHWHAGPDRPASLDGPTGLRAWAGDEAEHAKALESLARGEFTQVRIEDAEYVISLTSRPMPLTFTAAWRAFAGTSAPT